MRMSVRPYKEIGYSNGVILRSKNEHRLDWILFIACSVVFLMLCNVGCRRNTSESSKDISDNTPKQKEITLEDVCLALVRDLKIKPDSKLGKCIIQKNFTYYKESGYYSACGLLDFSLSEKVFTYNTGRNPEKTKEPVEIKGYFYFSEDGKLKAQIGN